MPVGGNGARVPPENPNNQNNEQANVENVDHQRAQAAVQNAFQLLLAQNPQNALAFAQNVLRPNNMPAQK